MPLLELDPVMTGFEQPFTMTPVGQARAAGIEYDPFVPQVDGGFFERYRQEVPAGFQPQVQQAGLGLAALAGPAVPAIAGALGITMPGWLLAALGIGAAGFAGYQALGGGEGGGLFGLNILGGDEFQMGGLEFGGPGLPEPKAPYTEWRAGNKQFYHVPQYSPTTGKYAGAKIAMYNRDTKKWKVWRLPKPYLAIIGKNMPRHQMIVRLRKNLRRHTADAKTILQVSSPAYYAKMTGYHKHRRGR